MSSQIPEADWRRFKEVSERLLEDFCSRILKEAVATSQSGQGTAHERYLKLYGLIQNRDGEIANAFNDFRRSTAIMQLAIMRRMKLLRDEDLSRFSEQTQQRIEAIASL
jgi:hypothetical protein